MLSPSISPFEPPGILCTLLVHPVTALFTFLHRCLLSLRGSPHRPPPHATPIRVVCISDTHCKIPPQPFPPGDLLVHAGDLTNNGTISEIQQSIDWLKTLLKPSTDSSDGFQHIVVVCGNHDSYFDERSRSTDDRRETQRKLDWGKIQYLQYSSVSLTFRGERTLKIYGAPQIPECGGKEFAFQYPRGQDTWSNTIPEDVDILVTHNPPKWHLDLPENGGLGCEFELKEVWRVKPTLHVFGHIHTGYGRENVWWDKGQQGFEAVEAKGYGTLRTFGPLSEIIDLSLWTYGFKMVYHDVRGLLLTRLWRAGDQGGIMLNAALTYRMSGRLLNRPQVVLL